MNPCTAPAPLCSGESPPRLAKSKRPPASIVTGKDAADAARRVVRALRNMGDRVPRPS